MFNLYTGAIVNVIEHFGQIPHVKPLMADRATHEVLELGLRRPAVWPPRIFIDPSPACGVPMAGPS